MSKKMLQAAAGNVGESLYVEDVFSTYLYAANNSAQGNGNTQTINNGLDLSGEGGLVWIKKRGDDARSHVLMDTERGATKALSSNTTSAERTDYTGTDGSGTGAAFTSTGFTVGDRQEVNAGSGDDFASWTFRKAEKFFDVVTYTGNGTSTNDIAHNLGAVPAFVIIKRTDVAQEWVCSHVNLSNLQANYDLHLNDTGIAAQQGYASFQWNDTSIDVKKVTDTLANANASGGTYVAYLFASDAGGFGDDGSESIIKCGSYTGNATERSVTLGWEPQWVMIKNADNTDNWWMVDNMRGVPTGSEDALLKPNKSDDENSNADYIDFNSTGFTVKTAFGIANENGSKYIYIAIRRPMKTPESGTEVFNPVAYTGSGSARTLAFNNPIDTALLDWRSGANQEGANFVAHRLLDKYFAINNTAAAVDNVYFELDNSDGVYHPGSYYNSSGNNYVTWGLTRAKGFYDVVIGGGKSLSSEVLSHNLGVTPELVLIRGTEQYGNAVVSVNLSQWIGWAGDYNYYSNSGFISAWDSTTITTQQYVSNTTSPQSIMLFASLAGVSKVGTYSGNGSTKTIDCGFTAGARFVMLKRTDAGSNQGVTTSNWYIWDSARGISAGNDPYLTNSLSSTFTENNATDSIDPHSSGFILNQNATTDVNKSGASYIYLAIA